ncbi:MAG TPA: hypothetical protein VN980_13420 [Alphaproteobacteria bacterium]|nr:hypothetical protein [Alphaproteobacteria bacterium]
MLAALAVGLHSPAIASESAQEALRAMGFDGTWSQDCATRAVFIRYSIPSDGTATVESATPNASVIYRITSAELAAGRIHIVAVATGVELRNNQRSTGVSVGTSIDVVWEALPDGHVHLYHSLVNDAAVVENGHFVKTSAPTPLFEKCPGT